MLSLLTGLTSLRSVQCKVLFQYNISTRLPLNNTESISIVSRFQNNVCSLNKNVLVTQMFQLEYFTFLKRMLKTKKIIRLEGLK